MRAVYLTGHGGNEVVAMGERPMPQRQRGEVLVRVHAATLNRVDLYMRDSGAGITHTLPQVMGIDGAGIVEAVEAGQHGLQVGDRVLLYPGVTCGQCEFCTRGDEVLCTRMHLLGEHRDGTMAEYISVPTRNAVPMPPDWTFEDAAALGDRADFWHRRWRLAGRPATGQGHGRACAGDLARARQVRAGAGAGG